MVDISTEMRVVIIALLLLLGAIPLTADSYSIVLSNQEAETFHYVLDPPELEGFNPSVSISSTLIYEYFAAGEGSFTAIPPDGVTRLAGLSQGEHLVVGFFEIPGKGEYPVRVLKVRAGGGMEERFYTLYKEPTLISARVGAGRLTGFTAPEAAAGEEKAGVQDFETGMIQIDNLYEDWQGIPYLARFSEDFAPPTFTREQYGDDFQVFAIEQAQHWTEGGTNLGEVKAITTEDRLYLFCSTHSAISENFSLFLYLHGDRSQGRENRITLELAPAGTNNIGFVVLWVKGQQPLAVGKLAAGSLFLEAEIPWNVLNQALDEAEAAQPVASSPMSSSPMSSSKMSSSPMSSSKMSLSFDLTTAYYDSSEIVYEEFFFTTLAAADIPSPAQVMETF